MGHQRCRRIVPSQAGAHPAKIASTSPSNATAHQRQPDFQDLPCASFAFPLASFFRAVQTGRDPVHHPAAQLHVLHARPQKISKTASPFAALIIEQLRQPHRTKPIACCPLPDPTNAHRASCCSNRHRHGLCQYAEVRLRFSSR